LRSGAERKKERSFIVHKERKIKVFEKKSAALTPSKRVKKRSTREETHTTRRGGREKSSFQGEGDLLCGVLQSYIGQGGLIDFAWNGGKVRKKGRKERRVFLSSGPGEKKKGGDESHSNKR